MNKALIIPVVALVALMVKQLSGVELQEEQIDIIVEGILAIATLSGIFMNPKKK